MHVNYVNWFKFQFPELADDLHHFANERACSPQQGALLKRMGVSAGVYDLFLGLPQKGFHGFWLELKTPKGVLSDAQISFGNRKIIRGYFCMVSRSLEDAKEVTLNYLSDYIANSNVNELKNGTNN